MLENCFQILTLANNDQQIVLAIQQSLSKNCLERHELKQFIATHIRDYMPL